MIEKVVITDNTKTPIRYISKLKNFENGKEYCFKAGTNIIVGENGCGKTTLMNLIKAYLLVDFNECSLGMFNSNITKLFGFNSNLLDGADVYADYKRNTFRLSHNGEKERAQVSLDSIENFRECMAQKHSSTGEGVQVAIKSLFNLMFGKDAHLSFDYKQPKLVENYPKYIEYVTSHTIKGDRYTILMDEPDRNLSIDSLLQIKGILSHDRPDTQLIVVIHNPLIIAALSKNPNINIIEMTEGYVDKIKDTIKKVMQ